MNNDIIYDLETYPNFFSATFLHAITGYLWVFELSPRQNDLAALLAYLRMLQNTANARQVGYNNLGFDYPILHMMLLADGLGITTETIYQKVQDIFANQDGFGSSVRPSEVIIPQIDLFKIHHFDNKAKRTSLKALQFNMRSESVEDLPFEPGTLLTVRQMDKTLEYNFHDVAETLKFYYESLPMIEFRETLTEKYSKNFLNHNDVKIGKDYLVMALESAAPGSCYDPQTRKPRQTLRYCVDLKDVIFPYIKFTEPELNRVLAWFTEQRVYEYDKPSINCTMGGLALSLGIGGLHGSVNKKSLKSDDIYCILDIDVSGFYPSLAIVNRLYPEHLGEYFCDIYKAVVDERRLHPKGSAINGMLKLAGNGVYGMSGEPYSPFYDLQFMYSITVNGQLLLCMLIEQLIRVPSVELIQANTDGITLKVRRDQLDNIRIMTKWWENLTKLTLEESFYSAMYIRDVNAYFAVGVDGKVKKRKGPFSWVRGPNLGIGELAWHQDHSALIVPMAAEDALLHNCDPSGFIYRHTDIFDFMLRAKVSRTSRLELADGTRLANIVRFYISKDGQALFKVMPPAPGCRQGDYKRANGLTDHYFYNIERDLPFGSATWDARIHTKNRSTYDFKRMGIEVGYTVTVANQIRQASFENINYNYYIDAARKLVDSTVNRG